MFQVTKEITKGENMRRIIKLKREMSEEYEISPKSVF
jgi:hypothetical protein